MERSTSTSLQSDMCDGCVCLCFREVLTENGRRHASPIPFFGEGMKEGRAGMKTGTKDPRE